MTTVHPMAPDRRDLALFGLVPARFDGIDVMITSEFAEELRTGSWRDQFTAAAAKSKGV